MRRAVADTIAEHLAHEHDAGRHDAGRHDAGRHDDQDDPPGYHA